MSASSYLRKQNPCLPDILKNRCRGCGSGFLMLIIVMHDGLNCFVAVFKALAHIVASLEMA